MKLTKKSIQGIWLFKLKQKIRPDVHCSLFQCLDNQCKCNDDYSSRNNIRGASPARMNHRIFQKLYKANRNLVLAYLNPYFYFCAVNNCCYKNKSEINFCMNFFQQFESPNRWRPQFFFTNPLSTSATRWYHRIRLCHIQRLCY